MEEDAKSVAMELAAKIVQTCSEYTQVQILAMTGVKIAGEIIALPQALEEPALSAQAR